MDTLSSDLPPYQSATLQQNTEKCSKQTLKRLPFNKPSPTKENEKESSSDVEEDDEEDEKNGAIILRRVRWQSSKKVSHDIERVELDFGLSSDESFNEEDS